MNIHEYQAKELLRKEGVPIPPGEVASTPEEVEKLAAQLRISLASWDRRIPTGRLNSWLGEIVAQTPPPARGGRSPRLQGAAQARKYAWERRTPARPSARAA